jgi:hypothetical protein
MTWTFGMTKAARMAATPAAFSQSILAKSPVHHSATRRYVLIESVALRPRYDEFCDPV